MWFPYSNLPESSRDDDGATVPIAPLSPSIIGIPSCASEKEANDAPALRLESGAVSVKKTFASMDYHS